MQNVIVVVLRYSLVVQSVFCINQLFSVFIPILISKWFSERKSTWNAKLVNTSINSLWPAKFIEYSSAFNSIVTAKLITQLRSLELNTSLCNWILDCDMVMLNPRSENVPDQEMATWENVKTWLGKNRERNNTGNSKTKTINTNTQKLHREDIQETKFMS